MDGDGDYDVFTATDNEARNVYLENTGNVPDTHAPYIPNTEQAPNRAAGPSPTVIRAQVYDNAPVYITKYNATEVEYTVNGGAPQTVDAIWSGGQIFRAELPGNLVGNICYRWISADEYGNTGQSTQRCFTATGGGPATAYCFGDGTGTPCPCANTGSAGRGCQNGTGNSGLLTASGSASLSAANLVLSGAGLQPSQPGLYFQGNNVTGGGNGFQNGDGLRCAGGSIRRLQVRFANVNGESSTTVNIGAVGVANPGDTRRYQLWYRNPLNSPCGSTFNLTNGLEVVWQP